MSDLINRQKAIDELTKVFNDCVPDAFEELDIAVTTLRELPSTEQERTAKVVNIYQEYDLESICFFDYGDCDNCGAQVQRGDRYCSECGARLEWE